MATMRLPTRWASRERRASTAGIAALVGIAIPSASTRHAIVEAVPIVMQWPAERLIPASASRKSSADIIPQRTSSLNFHTCVPEPMS